MNIYSFSNFTQLAFWPLDGLSLKVAISVCLCPADPRGARSANLQKLPLSTQKNIGASYFII